MRKELVTFQTIQLAEFDQLRVVYEPLLRKHVERDQVLPFDLCLSGTCFVPCRTFKPKLIN